MPWNAGVSRSMPHGPRRPGFHLGVLAVGFVIGGLLQAFLRRFLPQGPAKELFTWSVTPTVGPVHLDLLVMSITLGPVGLDVSRRAEAAESVRGWYGSGKSERQRNPDPDVDRPARLRREPAAGSGQGRREGPARVQTR